MLEHSGAWQPTPAGPGAGRFLTPARWGPAAYLFPNVTELLDQLKQSLASQYRFERELGGGGMSRVFLAKELALARLVVLKALPPELGAALSADRFKREVRLAASLQHPHIVTLLSARRGLRRQSGGIRVSDGPDRSIPRRRVTPSRGFGAGSSR